MKYTGRNLIRKKSFGSNRKQVRRVKAMNAFHRIRKKYNSVRARKKRLG